VKQRVSFMRDVSITGGKILIEGEFAAADIAVREGIIAALDGRSEHRVLDATGLLVLPGIVDVHGDAFERQIEPRPGVVIDLTVALLETDRQLVANGITTAYHGVTWSWEPGLRGYETARRLMEVMETLRPKLACDTRYHLRHETFNLDAEAEIGNWLAAGRIGCLAFNDHMAATIIERRRPHKMHRMIERSGLTPEAFDTLVATVHARAHEVPASIERIASIARRTGIPMLSHDDMNPDARTWYRDLGCQIAEFPTNERTAASAHGAGDIIVFGAPNVIRGGSHTGCPNAAEMVAQGLCTVLASDYYYPALALAPFRLAADARCSFAAAWNLVSAAPAAALGLSDRGRIAPGLRGDLVLVEPRTPDMPRIVATVVAGRIVHLADSHRLS
jgi:alpha-D-ribose 1-methylphosphonate 5-triphosphate diphosphatase